MADFLDETQLMAAEGHYPELAEPVA